MTTTLANTITAETGLIPGMAFVGPAMGLPLDLPTFGGRSDEVVRQAAASNDSGLT